VNDYLTTLAAALQALFTTTAEALGRATHFIQRQRRLTAPAFAQALVFRWMAKPDATLESLARQLAVSPQALHQRLGPAAQAFLRALLVEALRAALRVKPGRLGLLDRFSAVVVEDTTVIALPPELAGEFPGCGGGSGAGEGAAALKVLLRWDLRSGAVLALSAHAGRASDQELAARAADLPEGALHLADQGFFNTERWRAFSPRQFWVSRVPARTRVRRHGAWQSLGALLDGVRGDRLDEAVALVEKSALPCRLVARRCPPEVAGRRRQRLREYTRSKKGREPSAAQLRLCDWLAFATNCAAGQLGAAEVWVAYRCRWQAELLFKRAKSLAGWGSSRGRRGARVLAELYAKLLGLVVLHWGTLLGRAAQRRQPVEADVRGAGVRPQLAGEPGAGRGGRRRSAGRAGPAAGAHPPGAEEAEEAQHPATIAQPTACGLT
jgi:DDE family transposase